MAEQYNDAVEKLKDPELRKRLQEEQLEQNDRDRGEELRRLSERVLDRQDKL